MSYADILKNHFERVKEIVMRWYDTVARWSLLAWIILYLAACVVGGGMVGPVRYIDFLSHCTHWQAAEAKEFVPPKTVIPLAPIPQKPKQQPKYNPESSF
jgi:hypothetical protein